MFYGLSLFRRLINDYCRFDKRMECGRIVVNGIVVIHGSTKPTAAIVRSIYGKE